MELHLIKLFKDKKSLPLHILFQFFCALFTILVFLYALTMIKVYLQNQKINEINKQMVNSDIYHQKIDERKIIDYKKKIDAFSSMVGSHRISSNVFNLIEEKTLPKIWFSNFDMLGSVNKVILSGEAQDIETLSRQVQIFEEDRDHIKNAYILDYQIEPSGKIRFIISLSLHSNIFNY